MDKYLISSNGLFRYRAIPFDNLGNIKIMFLDTVELEDEDDQNSMNVSLPFGANSSVLSSQFGNSSMKTLTIKVFTKELDPNNVKTINYKDVNNLYEDVINAYYENSFNKKGSNGFDPKFNIDGIDDEKSIRVAIAKIMNLSNLMAVKSRFGTANTVILSQKVYDKLSITKSFNINWIINPTNVHNDKIILARIDNEMTNIGIITFTDYEFESSRLIKLEHLLKKMGKKVEDRTISYNIDKLGNNCKYTTGVIYLNN